MPRPFAYAPCDPPLTLKSAFLGPMGDDLRFNPIQVELDGRILPRQEDGWPFEMKAVIEENARFTASLLMWPSLTPEAARMMARHLMQAWMGALCSEVRRWDGRAIEHCRNAVSNDRALRLTPEDLLSRKMR